MTGWLPDSALPLTTPFVGRERELDEIAAPLRNPAGWIAAAKPVSNA